MLYWRLPDSIDTTCCKSAHDHYVLSKGQLVNQKKNDKASRAPWGPRAYPGRSIDIFFRCLDPLNPEDP